MQAKELTELAKRNGLILQVGHIFRFDPASVWMRDAIAQERFGEIKMLRANFSGFKRPRQDTGVTFETAEIGTQHRSEEHTSELQSRQYLVCRLLLEKKKKNKQK